MSTKWVKRAKGDGVKCRMCVRGYDQEVDPDDTYASTPSLITLTLLLTLAVAHGWYLLAGDVSTAFLHALLTDEVFVIPPVEYYPNGVWTEAVPSDVAAALRKCCRISWF